MNGTFATVTVAAGECVVVAAVVVEVVMVVVVVILVVVVVTVVRVDEEDGAIFVPSAIQPPELTRSTAANTTQRSCFMTITYRQNSTFCEKEQEHKKNALPKKGVFDLHNDTKR
jgi:hypothetical protein